MRTSDKIKEGMALYKQTSVNDGPPPLNTYEEYTSVPQIRFKNNLKVDTNREQREYQTQAVNAQKPVNCNQKLHKNLSPDFTPLLSPASPNFIEQKSKDISSPSSHHSTIMCEDD